MTNRKRVNRFFLSFALVASCTISVLYIGRSHAEEKSIVDILPASSSASDTTFKAEDATHPVLRLTPDKSELVRLDEDAASVIVGNPLHASVLAESPRLLVVVPKAAGATYFTVLGENGKVLMQRHVIVASPKEDYVRVRKTCMATNGAEASDCVPTDVYYCPDMCHNIDTESEKEAKSSDSSDKKKDDKKKDDGASGEDTAEAEDGTTEE